MKKLMSIKETSQTTKLSPITLRAWANARKIASVRLVLPCQSWSFREQYW